MRKVFYILSVLLVVACSSTRSIKNVPEIKNVNATFDDYLSLFNAAGYNVSSYDISSLKDSVSSVIFSVREFIDSAEVENDNNAEFLTIYKISDFDEKDREEIIKMGDADDEANGIYRLATKMKIGLAPTADDCEQKLYFEISGSEIMGATNQQLIKRAFDKKRSPLKYSLRPFKIGTFEKDKFIPLLMYGSAWWDKDANIYRFCGEKEFSSDMKSEIFSHSPHYFIIGVEFK